MVELRSILQKELVAAGGYQGYKALLEQILKYFPNRNLSYLQRRNN